jgi:predicted DNA-binding protein
MSKRLPQTDQTETFVFRLSPKTKKKLEELSKRKKTSASALLREFIESASRR